MSTNELEPAAADPPVTPQRTAAESRMHVAILFTDLSDSTHLSGAMESETYATMLGEVRQAFRAAVEARGGTVNQYQGDGLQALFGPPDPSEHDGRRAVEAALDVHEQVRSMRARYRGEGAESLSVHSGVHAGLTLVRPGDDVAGRIELFGAAPGIAKHLSDTAEADEILASDETLGPMGGLFDTGPARRVLLKGRSEPLSVRRIVSRSARRTRFEAHSQRGLVSFVGREKELARLDELLDAALGGRACFAVVLAPAGLGKTRLADEFLHRASRRGCTTLRGYCENNLAAEPLQPFLQMLRAQLQLAPDAPAAAVIDAIETRLMARAPKLEAYRAELLQALSITPQAVQGARRPAEQVVRALRDVIAALARQSPLVLFIDDWQWADDATRQLLYTLAEDSAQPLLVLAAARPSFPQDLSPVAAEVIHLAPLGEREARSTVAEMLPAVDPFVAAQIIRQGGGNPLFIEELCHFAAHAGEPAAFQQAQGGPAWLEALIASRVARLAPGPRRVIDAAAVIGNLVPAWLLERLTGCSADHPDVVALADEDLLFPAEEAGMLRFKHGITRDVVYGTVRLQERRAAHRQAAALLAAPDDPGAEAQACEALAYHWSGAGDHARAAHCAALAGDKAMMASSIDRAKAQYRAALERMDRLPASAELYRAWRSVVRRLGLASVFDPARADLALFERAIQQAGEYRDVAGLAFASYWLAYINYALGESNAAILHCETALRAAEEAGDQRLALQVRVLQGQAAAAAGDAAVASALLSQALALMVQVQAPATKPTPGLAYTFACRASALGDQGRFEEAHADFARALDALPSQGHEVEGSVLCLRSNVNLWQQRWDDAAADACAAQRVAERVRSLYLLAMGRSLAAWADWQRRSDAGALQALVEATTWLIARDKGLFISLNHGRLAEGLAACGQHADARRYAAAALRRWRKRDPFGAPMALRAMARLAAAGGDLARAARRLAWADRIAQTRDSAHERAANARCRAELAPDPVRR